MKINSSTLPSMRDFAVFERVVKDHAKESLTKALLNPMISRPRLYDAHHAWLDDLARVEKHEKNLAGGLDHYKRVAHLAYWMRRMSPFIGFEDRTRGIEEETDLYEDEQIARSFMAKFGSEYLAFDLGFRICFFYEKLRTDGAQRSDPPKLTEEFISDVCHMMKFKHVSPHSLYLVYRSIML